MNKLNSRGLKKKINTNFPYQIHQFQFHVDFDRLLHHYHLHKKYKFKGIHR